MKNQMSAKGLSRKKKPYIIFILPALILYTVFVIVPIFYSMYLSFFEWSGLGPKKFIGFNNYITLFTNERISPIFYNALKNNIKYMFSVWLIITPIQYFLAYMIYLKIKAYRYLRFLIFLPYVISSTIVSFFITIIFDPNIGFINKFLETIGMSHLKNAWFGNPNLAFMLLVIVIMWQGIGSGMMIFYAGMQGISKEVMDSATIDGAGKVRQLFSIVIPLSRPAIVTNVILSTIWSLSIFDLPYMIGGQNGGVNNTIDFVNMVFYRYTFGSAFAGKSDMGFGAAISVVMFVVMFLIWLIQNKLIGNVED